MGGEEEMEEGGCGGQKEWQSGQLHKAIITGSQLMAVNEWPGSILHTQCLTRRPVMKPPLGYYCEG